MFVRLKNGTDYIIISINTEPKEANLIIQQARWIVTHISSNDVQLLLYDLQPVIPTLTVDIVDNILIEYNRHKPTVNFFINVCNILAHSNITNVVPCEVIEI